MRVYHNTTSGEDRAKLCEVACANSNLDLCDIADFDGDFDIDLNNVVPTVWRFLPMADPKVSLYVWGVDLETAHVYFSIGFQLNFVTGM